MDFSESVVVYDLKLATDDRSAKRFLLTSKHCPLNHERKYIKSDFKRDFFETCNKWVK